MRDRYKNGKLSLVVCDCGRDVKKRHYDRGFVARVRIARESSGLSRETIAKELGIKPDTYARYEIRVMMPHHHIPRFLALTGISADYLFATSAAIQKVALSNQ